MMQFELTRSEVDHIETLLAIVMQKYTDEKCEQFLNNIQYLAHQLPQRLCRFLADFKHYEMSSGVCLISGFPVDQGEIGDTPTNIDGQCVQTTTRKEHFLSCLVSSLLGDVFGWATQQNGKLVHDLSPIKEHEYEQIGSGSKEDITLHCEDAFHDYRADYLCLMCLRNPESVETTFATLDRDALTLAQRHLLFSEKFIIRPDNSHLEFNNAMTDKNSVLQSQSYSKISKALKEGIEISVLFGDIESPYLRLDPYFMDEPEDTGSRDAYYSLCQALSDNTMGVALNAGDILFVDNYRVLHGRQSFKAHFNGQDRWLKRINITRDLRRSRELRPHAGSRIIY